MEMHQLEYVLAVAKYHNFTRASEALKTSQSSLSQQIIKLENELGISLFVRTTRSVQISPAGEEFVKHAKRIILEAIEACGVIPTPSMNKNEASPIIPWTSLP